MSDGIAGLIAYFLLVGVVVVPIPVLIYARNEPGRKAVLLTLAGFVVEAVLLFFMVAMLDREEGLFTRLFLFFLPIQMTLMIFWTALGARLGRTLRKRSGSTA